MPNMTDLLVPLIICLILVFGLIRGVKVFDVFIKGAKEGVLTAVKILPALIAILTAVGMFKASGALDILTHAFAPVTDFAKIPKEVLPLALLRPISGSGALAMLSDILTNFGPDSYIGRVASVMQGSTETTFYTIAVYYGAVGVTKTRYTLPASLAADLVGVVMSAFAVRLLLGA